MQPLFTYIDFRRYLGDYYEHKKRSTAHFSYRYLSNRAGFSSPVFIKLVIDGKRNLSLESCAKLSAALDHSEREAVYFKNLVLFNQATTAAAKSEHYAVLLSMMNCVAEQRLNGDQYEYLSQWYHPVVREIVCSNAVQRDDLKSVATLVSPPISLRQARESVALLARLGLIAYNMEGRCQRTDTALTTDARVAPLAIRNFNAAMIEKALAAIDGYEPSQRHISGITCGVSKECFEVLRTEIAAFKERMVAIINRDNGCERVYQLNVQLFPLSDEFGHTRQSSTAEENS